MKKRTLKRLFGIVGILALSAGLAACGSSDDEGGDSSADGPAMTRIKESGVLNLATSPGYAPYEFIDLNSSATDIVGVDIALGERLAEELGVDLRINEMTFGSIIGSLKQDSVDIALAGMSITEERKESIDFSEPYLESENRVIALEQNADNYKTIDDLKEATIGVQKSTTQETIVNEAIEPEQVVSLEKLPDAILNLISGQVDAIIIEDTVAQQYIMSGNNIVFTDVEIPEEYRYKYTAIGVNKGNEDLLEVINKVIEESQADGSIEEWIAEYSEIAMKSAESAN